MTRATTPFAWGTWRRFYRTLLSRGEGGALREGLLRATMAVAAEAGWRLDRPAPPPRDVLLVVGHQRSGTTWLHRLLAAQPGAGALPLHALLFPADTWQSLFQRLDFPAWLSRLEQRLFGSLRGLHTIALREPEEDELALWAIFRSPMNGLDRPWPAGDAPEIDVDDVALGFYAQVVAKAARRSGGRYVGKNPHFTHRLGAIRAVLPAARFVQLVRHPAEAIASRIGLIRAIWRRRFQDLDQLDRGQVEAIYKTSVRCYLGGHGAADLDVAYADLVGDPVATVERIHRELDLGPTAPGLREMVAASLQRSPASRHTLEEFGLDRQRVACDLAPVYSRWGFPV